MSDEERFVKYVRESFRDLDPPPRVPREEMWARIDEARRFRRRRHGAVREFPVWLRWGVGLAAMLAVGIGIGRLSVRPVAPPTGTLAQGAAGTQTGIAEPEAYRVATVQYLTRAEALLTSFPEDTRSGRTEEVATWASDLLVHTRLLRDSPAADDPRIAQLLDDLEVVLAQLSALSSKHTRSDVRIIRDGINQNDVLLRLRAVTTATPTAGT